MTNKETNNGVDLNAMKQEIKDNKQKAKTANLQKAWLSTKNVIIGIWMVLVFSSIAYSTVVIFIGTSDIVSKIMITPQALFIASMLIHKFIK